MHYERNKVNSISNRHFQCLRELAALITCDTVDQCVEVQFCCSLVDQLIRPYHPPLWPLILIPDVQSSFERTGMVREVRLHEVCSMPWLLLHFPQLWWRMLSTSCTKCCINRSTMYALPFQLNCWFHVAVHAVCCHVWVHHLPVSCSISQVCLVCGDARQTTVCFAAMEQRDAVSYKYGVLCFVHYIWCRRSISPAFYVFCLV